MATQIGISQVGKPAPLGYRRFVNAWSTVLAPAIAGFGLAAGISGHAAAIFAAAIALATAIVQGFGMILGNSQIYSAADASVTTVPDPAKPAA